jgi:hypothetical protein
MKKNLPAKKFVFVLLRCAHKKACQFAPLTSNLAQNGLLGALLKTCFS